MLSFKKGIHPKYNKEMTAQKPIEVLMPGQELVYPMQQHIGSMCKPVVKKGDRVLVGEKLGEATSYLSVPIYSSVSGTVTAVEERLTHQGVKVLSVVVANDDLYEEAGYLGEKLPTSYKNLSRDEMVQKIKEAGLVGMGGAAFPTFVKLSPPEDKVIDAIIINGAECEPYLTSDHRVMLEEGERIIEGIRMLLHMFDSAKAYIGIEDNKKDAIKNLEELCQKEEKIQVKVLETKYPQGSEKHLIYAITGKEVPSGKLPADVGTIVLNIDSCVAIWRTLTKGRPIMRRIVTVSGKGVERPCNLKVRIGTSYREILEKAGWDANKTVKIISGGPMMGQAISSIDIPVVKGTSAILCLTAEEMNEKEASACIRCGKCVEACPMRLVPNTLHKAAMDQEDETFKGFYGMDCIECGCCGYVCPAQRPLVQTIRTAKNRIRTAK